MLIKKGFTLVELLIVIAILSILTTLGVANFRTARIKARDLERKSDLQTIAKSLEAYVNDHRGYPNADSTGRIVCQSDGTVCPWGSGFTDGVSIYAGTLPSEGNSDSSYIYESDTLSYSLYAHLENTNDPALMSGLGVDCGNLECNYKISSSNVTP